MNPPLLSTRWISRATRGDRATSAPRIRDPETPHYASGTEEVYGVGDDTCTVTAATEQRGGRPARDIGDHEEAVLQWAFQAREWRAARVHRFMASRRSVGSIAVAVDNRGVHRHRAVPPPTAPSKRLSALESDSAEVGTQLGLTGRAALLAWPDRGRRWMASTARPVPP
jgi:hypothetical protein